MEKIWVDDIRPAPEGYVWLKSVNEAKSYILNAESIIAKRMEQAHVAFLNRDYALRNRLIAEANIADIKVIDLDHDAGIYAKDGGDYIKLLDWLEETDRRYGIKIHTQNPVGRENMQRIIDRNRWYTPL